MMIYILGHTNIDLSALQKLTRGTENWSLSELMHAIALLAHFHALASFVYGCGVNAEIDQEEGHTYRMPSVTENGASSDVSAPTTPNSVSCTVSISVCPVLENNALKTLLYFVGCLH